MAENITATVGTLYFTTEQAKISGGRTTHGASKGMIRRKKAKQFFKNGVPVSEEEFFGLSGTTTVVKNITGDMTDAQLKKLMKW